MVVDNGFSIEERRRSGRFMKGYAFKGRDVAADIRQKYGFEGDLLEIYAEGGEQLVHKWHHYLPLYDRYFREWRGKEVRFLEIGVSKGGSLSMWRRYFGPKAIIFGIDINEDCRAYDGIHGQVRIGSQDDPAFLEAVIAEMGGVDIVLDDGSHMMPHVRKTLEIVFQKVSLGGTYMIEDLHTAYWPGFGGGLGEDANFFNYVRELMDDMHGWYHDGKARHPIISNSCTGVHLHDSICVLEKGQVHQPVHSKIQRSSGDGPLSFVIQTAAPNARVMPNWGDYFFAKGLAEALERLGHKARIQSRADWAKRPEPGEIDIVLRGRAEYVRRGTTPTLYWVISGGEHVPRPELEQADHIFVAGKALADRWSRQVGADKVSVMWQAFDATRMPMPPEKGKRSGIVFVGIARKMRPIVQIALQTRYSMKLWGNGWRETEAAKNLVADRIDNDDLGGLYAGAEIVLNDQTRIMRKAGLVSNRIFDALACGAAVVTTPTGGLPEDVLPYVSEVSTPEEFTEAVRAIRAETKEQRAKRDAFGRKMRETHSFDARAKEIMAKVTELRDIKLAAEEGRRRGLASGCG